MSLRQPQAFLRVPRGRLVSLFTPRSRLNAGECRRGGPRATKHKRLDLSGATFPWRRASPGSRAGPMMPEMVFLKPADHAWLCVRFTARKQLRR
jgi:hypothetical protein